MTFKDLPIRRKLVGLILLISMSVLLVGAAIMLLIEFRGSTRDMDQRLTAVGDIIAANSAAVLVFDEPKLAREILSGLSAETDIVEAALYDKSGEVVAQYPDNPPVPAFRRPPPTQRFRWFHARNYTLHMPVFQYNKPVGTLYIKADYRQMYDRLAGYGIASLVVLIGCAVLAFLLSNRLERWISRPLLDLAKVAKEVSEKKDYTVRAASGGADEFGTLTSAFNSMLGQIQTSHVALLEGERRFRMIADNIPVLAWTADELGHATWYNKQWYDYTGATPEQMVGRGWEQLHHPDHLGRVKRTLEQAIQDRTVWQDAFPLRGTNGMYRWFLSRAVPIFNDEGEILRWFGTSVDITDLREAERSRARLATIVETSQDAIISMTLEGEIQTWNRGAERMFGYNGSEVIGKSISILVPPDLRSEEESILERQRQGEPLEHYETVRMRKDGSQVEVSLSVSPLRDANGNVVGASKIARDITEKKRAEREMERARDAAEAANRAKDDFLAALSHELRTPLMPVLFTISTMQHDRALPSNVRDNLGMIRRNIEIESRMVNDLLDLTRIRVNKLELSFVVTDLREIVRRALEVCRGNKKFSQLKFNVALDAGEHFVRGDADRLQQVFWNLIQNAMKFTPPGGQITIQSCNRDQLLCVSVADNGCGIEPELLSKIFEPFEQAGRKGKESLQGLGLGLAIAQRIVAAHGGTLTAASEGVDRGAVFTLEIQTVPAPTGEATDVEEPEMVSSNS